MARLTELITLVCTDKKRMIGKFSKAELLDCLYALDKKLPRTCERNVILSAGFVRLGIPEFSLTELIDLVIDTLSLDSLALQTYSEFDDQARRSFSRYYSPVTASLSSLSKTALHLYPECRLLSPTHSFVLLGRTRIPRDHIFTSAFGLDSTFEFFLNNNYHWINLGLYLDETCTFLHHAEWRNRDVIGYRRDESFEVAILPTKAREPLCKTIYTYYSKVPNATRESSWLSLRHDNYLSSIAQDNGPLDRISSYPLGLLLECAEKALKRNSDALSITLHHAPG